MRRWPELLAVVIGGLTGSALRLGIDLLVPQTPAGFPIGTFAINVVGSFALGVLAGRVQPSVPAWLRAGLGPGLLGAFTTFSAVAVAAVDLGRAEAYPIAVAYPLASIAAGLGAAAAGLALGVRRPRGDAR